ncbi:hypothetical protein HanIR_Chr14g0699651 [Helianthus annuus]|nr:hypothetical protein HanIR_Chr14g0699651 [Helianthus annuus]
MIICLQNAVLKKRFKEACTYMLLQKAKSILKTQHQTPHNTTGVGSLRWGHCLHVANVGFIK